MHDLSPVLAGLTFAYGSALAGSGCGLLLRAWFRRRGRVPAVTEAAWCAWMPAVTLIAMLLVSCLPERLTYFGDPLHRSWHNWADALSDNPTVHNALHAANVVVLLCAGAALARTTYVLARMRALLGALYSAPVTRQAWDGYDVFCLDTCRPFCFTIGLWRPRIYASTGLLQAVSGRHLNAVFAHEAAHARRRDGLADLAMTVFHGVFALPGNATLGREWRQAAERVCDAAAARDMGDPCDVAEALVEVARIGGRPSVPGAVFFTSGEDIEGRVHALLASPRGPQTSIGHVAGLSLACGLACSLAAQTWVRHLVELFVYH